MKIIKKTHFPARLKMTALDLFFHGSVGTWKQPRFFSCVIGSTDSLKSHVNYDGDKIIPKNRLFESDPSVLFLSRYKMISGGSSVSLSSCQAIFETLPPRNLRMEMITIS